MSACVTTCVAVQTTEAPGASVAGIVGVHAPSTAPVPGSVTVTPVNVWLPVFVTVIEYVITSPTESYGPLEVTALTTFRDGCATSVFVIVHVTFSPPLMFTVA